VTTAAAGEGPQGGSAPQGGTQSGDRDTPATAAFAAADGEAGRGAAARSGCAWSRAPAVARSSARRMASRPPLSSSWISVRQRKLSKALLAIAVPDAPVAVSLLAMSGLRSE